MKYLFLIVSMVCSTNSIYIQPNTSLHTTYVSDEDKRPTDKQTPYQIDDAKQPGKLSSLHAERMVKSSVPHEKPISQDDTNPLPKNTYVYNEFPTDKERDLLEFIRKTMTSVLGTNQMCDKQHHIKYRVPGSACSQDCSCDVSCHTKGDCCPDVQHKLNDGADQQDKTEESLTIQPVCITMPTSLTGSTTTKPPSEDVSIVQKDMVSQQSSTTLQTTKIDDTFLQKSTNGTQIYKDSLTNEPESFYHQHYLVIASCPSNFTDQSIIEKCQRDSGSGLRDIIPMYDELTHEIYRNEHCALCHEAQASPWTIESDCIQLYTNSCLTNHLSDLIELTQTCKIVFTPPRYTDLSSLQCRLEHDIDNVIASCNVTGLWTESDERISDLCLQPSSISRFYQYQENKLITYRNMFCYLCNQAYNNTTSPQLNCPNDTLSQRKDTGSLFAHVHVVLDADQYETCDERWSSSQDTTNISQTDGLACDIDQFWDSYMNKCRKLYCPINGVPIGTMCIEKHRTVKGLIFSAQLMVTMGKDDSISTEDSISVDLETQFNSIYTVIDKHLGLSVSNCITRHAEIFAKTENNTIHFFVIQIKVENTLQCPVRILTEIFDKISVKKTLNDAGLFEDYGISMLQMGLEFRKLFLQDINFRQVLVDSPINNSNEIILKPNFNCPTIKLSIEDYELSIHNNVIERLDEKSFKLQFSTKTNTVDICLMSYLQKWLLAEFHIKQPMRDTNKKGDSTISMIATLTSMISTIITLITYGLFSELRFVPGKLFMILCINLLLAQLFFAFGENSGYPVFWCQFVGIGIHFFWLATIFSMNSCMLLMVRSVKSPLEQHNRVIMQSKSISKASNYIIFSYVVPLLIVLSTLLAAWINKEPYGGYGGKFCYISTIVLRIYTFAVPVGIVITINLTIFTLIFTTIMCQMKNTKVLEGTYKHIFIFLKLCTITGIFWTFGFIYEATRIQCFQYMFTILNGGQGFFLMWSFILNKRVLGLYIHKWHDLTVSTTYVYVAMPDPQ